MCTTNTIARSEAEYFLSNNLPSIMWSKSGKNRNIKTTVSIVTGRKNYFIATFGTVIFNVSVQNIIFPQQQMSKLAGMLKNLATVTTLFVYTAKNTVDATLNDDESINKTPQRLTKENVLR